MMASASWIAEGWIWISTTAIWAGRVVSRLYRGCRCVRSDGPSMVMCGSAGGDGRESASTIFLWPRNCVPGIEGQIGW